MKNKVSLENFKPGSLDPFALVEKGLEDADALSSTSSIRSPIKYFDTDNVFESFPSDMQFTEKGLDEVKKLTFSDLQRFSGYNVDMGSPAGDFLLALKAAYVLMIERIIERYPVKSYREPQTYPEYEIYDSVPGVMEDDELETLGFAFGGEDFAEDEIDHVVFTVYEELNEVFCSFSNWDLRKMAELRGLPYLASSALSVQSISDFMGI